MAERRRFELLEQKNVRRISSAMLERFFTEVTAMMVETCDTAAKLNKLLDQNPLQEKETQSNEKVFRFEFGNGDKRAEDARK